MINNIDLKSNLIKKKYPNGIQYLIQRFRRPYPTQLEYIRRLDNEYKIINQKGFVKTFHRVCDLLDLIKDKNIPHVLRGSAASSLVCYQLGISDINPIEQNIPLTRFMNFCRDTQPDIDLDVPHWIRDNLIQDFHEIHPNKVARISNKVMYKPKSAMREAIRKFGYRKFVPRNYKLKDIFPDVTRQKQVKQYAKSLIGQQRQWSLHCGGLIVFNDKVPQDLWLDKSRKQIILDKYDVEEQNLIKIDLLCNRGLSQLWELSSKPVADYPIDDKLASEVLCRGDVLGLTQSESRTMRKTLIALQPKSMYRRGWSKQNPVVIKEFMDKLNSKQTQNIRMDIIKELKHSPKYSYCRGHALSYGQLVWALAYWKARNPQEFWKATIKHCHSSYRKWVHKRQALLNGVYFRNKINGSPQRQFEKTGWWDSPDFLSSEFGCEESGGVTYFHGLVANSRTIYRYKKKLILMSIGVGNDKYVDLIIDKKIFKGGKQWIYVTGCGLTKKQFNSEFIEVSHLLP